MSERLPTTLLQFLRDVFRSVRSAPTDWRTIKILKDSLK